MQKIKILEKFVELDSLPKGVYSFLNPFTYHVLNHNEKLSLVDGYFIDGSILCLAIKLKGGEVNRVSFDFTSIAKDVFDYAKLNDLSVALVGSENSINESFCDLLVDKGFLCSSNLKISRSGFFESPDEMASFAMSIVESKIDLVVVGMGAGHQEVFLNCLKSAGFAGWGFSCGGFMHQTVSKKGVYYPGWIDKLNLRFIYRMYDEPKLISRYLFVYPKSVLKFFFDKKWRLS